MTDPLLGKMLMLDSRDGEYHTVSRFKARLDRCVYLMAQVQPANGEDAARGPRR
jgi:hypothetical protein